MHQQMITGHRAESICGFYSSSCILREAASFWSVLCLFSVWRRETGEMRGEMSFDRRGSSIRQMLWWFPIQMRIQKWLHQMAMAIYIIDRASAHRKSRNESLIKAKQIEQAKNEQKSKEIKKRRRKIVKHQKHTHLKSNCVTQHKSPEPARDDWPQKTDPTKEDNDRIGRIHNAKIDARRMSRRSKNGKKSTTAHGRP